MMIAVLTYNKGIIKIKEVDNEGNGSGNSDGRDIGFCRERDGARVPKLQRRISYYDDTKTLNQTLSGVSSYAWTMITPTSLSVQPDLIRSTGRS